MIKSHIPQIDNSTINSLENWAEIFGVELGNDKNMHMLMDFIEVKHYLKKVGYNFILDSDQVRWNSLLN